MKNTFTYVAMVAVVAFASVSAFAEEKNAVEFFGGYQFHNISTGLGEINDKFGTDFDNRITAHGVNLSLTGNITKYIGLKFDYSSTGRAVVPDNEFTDLKLRINQYLGGVQIKNNEKDGPRFKPFAHVLAGAANERLRCTQGCDIKLPTPTEGSSSTTFSESSTSFAMVFGGGLDVKVHPRIDIRVIQLDYNPIFYGGIEAFEIPNRTQNNFRIGFGIVIH